MLTLDQIVATEDDSEIGYLVDVDLETTYALEDKTRSFPQCP